MVSYIIEFEKLRETGNVLILVVMEDGLIPVSTYFFVVFVCVLILVVMEDGLIPGSTMCFFACGDMS